MRVIALSTLREFWERHADARPGLEAWYADVKYADWRSPADVKKTYRNASIVGSNRVVFNIKGNAYRVVVAVNYRYGLVYIRFVGSHSDYERIDVESI